jgi:hypothetical protein
MLKPGETYHFHSKSLGRCNLKFLGGLKFLIVGGWLQSQKTKRKWNEGEEFTLPALGIGDFWELPDIGEVAE